MFKEIESSNSVSLIKKRVYGPRKKFFFAYIAMISIKFPARVIPTPLFLTIYVIMTSFPQKLDKIFSFIDIYFIDYHFSYG